MGVERAGGGGGAPVDPGAPGAPGGPGGAGGAPEGGKPPPGAEGAPPEGGVPPGDDFGSYDGMVDQGEFFTMAKQEAGNDAQAQALLNQIRLNTVSHEASAGGDATRGMSDTIADHREGMTEVHDTRDSFVREGEARSEVRSAIRDALATGNQRELMALFSRFSAGDRAAARPNPGAATGNPANPANPGGTGTRGAPLASGGPSGGPTGAATPSNPPIFPGATGRLANLTQPRMTALSGRIANMPDGSQKTEAQQLEQRLRAAISASPPDREAAQAALDGLAAMGIELGETDEADEVEEGAETGEGDEAEGADGEGGGPGRAGGDGEGRRTRVARTFNPSEHLEGGMTVLCGGGRGGDAEVDAHGARMERGLSLVCGGGATGYATRVATDGAVRGRYAEGDGSGEGGGSGGASGDGSVAFGDMVDADGALASGGYRLDTAAAGLGGSYGVRTPDGRFIPQWMALSEHGGLPPGVRAAIGRDASLRTRFGAEALSGHRAGMTGDLFAGARC